MEKAFIYSDAELSKHFDGIIDYYKPLMYSRIVRNISDCSRVSIAEARNIFEQAERKKFVRHFLGSISMEKRAYLSFFPNEVKPIKFVATKDGTDSGMSRTYHNEKDETMTKSYRYGKDRIQSKSVKKNNLYTSKKVAL